MYFLWTLFVAYVLRALLVVAGVGSFVLAKRLIDEQRYQHMKSRERMKNANTGDYEPSERKF